MDLEKTSSDIESHLNQEIISLRTQVKIMGGLTTEKIDIANNDRKKFQ